MIFENVRGKKVDTSKADNNFRGMVEASIEEHLKNPNDKDYIESVEAYFEAFPTMIVGTVESKKEAEKKEEKEGKSGDSEKEKKETQNKDRTTSEKSKSAPKHKKTKLPERKEVQKKVSDATDDEYKNAEKVLDGIFDLLKKFRGRTKKTTRKKSKAKTLSQVVASETFSATERVVKVQLKKDAKGVKVDILKEAKKEGIEYIKSIAEAVNGIRDDASAPVKEFSEKMDKLISEVQERQNKLKK